MKMQRVDSSAVVRVGYERPQHVLRIEYSNGGVYDYQEVPEKEHTELLKAKSKGRYINYRIKPKYRHRQVRPPRS